MDVSFSINLFWTIFVFVAIVGYGFCINVAINFEGYNDFISPIVLIFSFILTTIVLVLLLLGKYVF